MSTVTVRPVSPVWLALLAGPLSFGITGPTLVLAEIGRDLGVGLAAAAAVVTAFGWGISVGTPLSGVLTTRRGHRSTLLASGVALLLGSALAAFAALGGGLAMLVLGEGLTGLGSAGMTVVALQLAATPASMGVVTATLAMVGALAPLIGTSLSSALAWPVVLVLPLLSLLAVPVAWRVPSVRADTGSADLVGAGLLVAWVTALVFIAHRPVVAVVVVLVVTVLFALHIRRVPDGVVPSALLRSPAFLGATGLAFALAVVNFALVYAAPVLLAARTGWSNAELGLVLLAPYLAGGLLSWFLVAFTSRLRSWLLVSCLVGGSAVAVLAVFVGGWVSVAVMLCGMGVGSLSAATGQGALGLRAGAAVPDRLRPTAMGLFTLFYLLGAAFGPAIAVVLTA
ncbi:MFS transporter [Pseudonocardia spinosispora]|uniref:MFS transporter n=1 Tax=Pseudonocardia spinosispora TaxID=103441 RepID=UPI00055EC029|nr:MFS transporter [Pseudonocardia spinosispora]